jgi:hypothetical protein
MMKKVERGLYITKSIFKKFIHKYTKKMNLPISGSLVQSIQERVTEKPINQGTNREMYEA